MNDLFVDGYISPTITEERKLNQILATKTGQPLDKIYKDTDRDFYMTADEALKYGIIDEIINK